MCISLLSSQIVLDANGSGNTYEDINAVLAPGYNVNEVPDCAHSVFGRHIDEIFDTELGTNVFRFFAHKTPDNDRCQNFDRQRTEIKTYNQSPDNLKATQGEIVQYKWKFKIPIGFQVSPNFTHLHQIKSVGGPYASIPMITLTARKATPDRLELRYTPINDQNTIQTVNLDLLRGQWIDVTETIHFSDDGSYSINLRKISDNTIILDYNNNNIDMWQDGATIARPKWGIYRSLINIDDLRDEEVLFNNFSIEENPTLTNSDLNNKLKTTLVVPNPAKTSIKITNIEAQDYDQIIVHNSTGRRILVQDQQSEHQLNLSNVRTGLYFVSLLKSNSTIKTFKVIIQ